jgi:hypothetical protein
MVLFDVADVAKARMWSVSQDLKSVMAQAGVSSKPSMYFIG